MASTDRLSLIEYGAPQDLVNPIAASTGLQPSQIRLLLLRSGARAAEVLGLPANPISVSGDYVRAVDIAGLLRVGPGIELEIAPKFLGFDSVNSRWREDFFFCATLSRHGRVLAAERLRAGRGVRDGLDTLVARAMIEMYWVNHRRPLRSYRTRCYEDAALDGDVEPETIVQPSPDGFSQTSMVYDRRNRYNAAVLAAAKRLLPNVRDPSLVAQLERVGQDLGQQNEFVGGLSYHRLPNRAQRWQSLYDLSIDVLKELGLSLTSGSFRAPGYVLDTWRVWEDVLAIAVRLGLGASNVRIQKSSVLGARHRIVNDCITGTAAATVTPDLTILDGGGTAPRFLVDAKYKTHLDNGRIRISEPDLYEAMAFSMATKCGHVLLAYPALPRPSAQLGQVTVFERVRVASADIVGVEIESGGISSVGGLTAFSRRVVEGLEETVLLEFRGHHT